MGLFSDWGSTFRTLDHINNTLGAVNNYIDTKNAGATTGQALFSAAANGTIGYARAEIASNRYERTGDMSGHIVNTVAGFGNVQSNVNGSIGLMLTEPGLFCGRNFFMRGPVMPFGYSMFGPAHFPPMPPMLPMVGGCDCNMPYMRFMGGGFYC